MPTTKNPQSTKENENTVKWDHQIHHRPTATAVQEANSRDSQNRQQSSQNSKNQR